MAICKDCIHYKCCRIWESNEKYFENVNIYNCCAFIDKSKIIELPCKVGDTVYTFSFDKIIEAEVIKVEWSCEAENYGKFIRGKITLYSKEFEEIRIDFYDLDKLFYLTREEAEKALKERENNA